MANGHEIAAAAIAGNLDGPAFGLLGNANLVTMNHFVQSGRTLHTSQHESGAICMAAGYARAADTVGFATVTRGPGLANAITALTSAVRDRVPLVVFAGDSPPGNPHTPQYLDHAKVAELTGARFIDGSAGGLRACIDAAFTLAAIESHPVLLNIPTNRLDADAAHPVGAIGDDPLAGAAFWNDAPAVDPARIAAAVERLRQAQRPVVLAGRGVNDAEVTRQLRAVGDWSGALFATSLPAVGRFAPSEFDVGFSGGFATPTVNQLLAGADVVLAVGASLNEHTTADGRLFADAFVIHADRDPAAIGRQTRADLALVGDAADTLAALAGAVAESGPAQDGYRTPQVQARIAASRRALDQEIVHTSRTVDPRAALRAIDDAITPTRRVVVDVGHFSTFPCQTMPAAFAGQLMPALGFAAVGLGVPTAIGAALATNDPVVAVVGDGGMLMSLPELRTLARTDARVVVAVLNDAAYGAEVHHLRRRGLADSVARFDTTDFVAVAEALGIRAARVTTPDDLERLPALLSPLDGPRLLDIAINPDVVANKFQ